MLATQDEEDCEYPIKEWSIVWAINMGCIILFMLAPCLLCRREIAYDKFFANSYSSALAMILLFTAGWAVLGSFWLFDDWDCYDGE